MSKKIKRKLPEGVKQTSGGSYDPLDRHVYFFASFPSYIYDLDTTITPHVLVAVNELKSEEEIKVFDELIKSGKKVMLDSGIFNLANAHAHRHGMTHNEALNLAPTDIDGFDSLYDRYCSIITKYKDQLWGAVELDQGGRRNKVVTRAKLESDIPGFIPIPVYHPLGDGWDYFDELAQNYDRICCGNIVQAPTPDRIRLAHLFHERAKKYPYLWTHVLGYTPVGTTVSIPPQGSCDSSTWTGPMRWGLQSTKANAFLTNIGSLNFDDRFNRDLNASEESGRHYHDMKRWSAMRFRHMNLIWQDIENRKAELGLTTQKKEK
jgi:hypothetical protein